MRQRGRPRKFAGRRPTWTVRLSEDVGEKVKGAAEKAGRSISEEIERRVDFSFRTSPTGSAEVEQEVQQVVQQVAQVLQELRADMDVIVRSMPGNIDVELKRRSRRAKE